MSPRLRLAVLAGLLTVSCPDPASIAPATTAASSSVVAPPAPSSAPGSSSALGSSAASTTAPTGDAPPDHWSTTLRDPETEKVFVEPHPGTGPGMEMLAACSVVSDDGDEGEVFLERTGSTVRGKWGDTVVTGNVADGGRLELVDAGTKAVVFRGVVSGAQLTGTVRAEGEERAVRSLPSLALEHLTAKIGPTGARRVLEIAIVDGKVRSASTKDWDRPKKPSPKTTAELDARGIAVTDERGTFRLHATARGFIGRPPGLPLVVASVELPSTEKGLPLDHAGVKLTSRHAKKGARGTSCDIDIELASVAGTPRDRELGKELERHAVESAAGMWSESEPAPTLASFQCQVDEFNDMIMKSASFLATPLAGRFVNLRIAGYARWSATSPPVTPDACLVLDGEKGQLVDLLHDLPPAAAEVIRASADKAFARNARSRKLTIDDFFVADALESLASTSLCATPTGVRLLVPTGVITKHLPSPPYPFDVPKERVAPKLPPGHVLLRMWE